MSELFSPLGSHDEDPPHPWLGNALIVAAVVVVAAAAYWSMA